MPAGGDTSPRLQTRSPTPRRLGERRRSSSTCIRARTSTSIRRRRKCRPIRSSPRSFADFNANVGSNRPELSAHPGGYSGRRHSDPGVVEVATRRRNRGGPESQIGTRGTIRVDFVDRKFGDFYCRESRYDDRNRHRRVRQLFDMTRSKTPTRSSANTQAITLPWHIPGRISRWISAPVTHCPGCEATSKARTSTAGRSPTRRFTLSRVHRGEVDGTEGDLSGDQRHKTRFWGTFMFPLGRRTTSRLSASCSRSSRARRTAQWRTLRCSTWTERLRRRTRVISIRQAQITYYFTPIGMRSERRRWSAPTFR